MDVGGADLGAACERDPDDVRYVARHELSGDDSSFTLRDRRTGPHGGHFGEAVDLELRDSEIDPGPLHETKAFDPGPWPNELGFDHGEIVPDDQKRHPRPLALHRLQEGIVKLLGAGIDSEDTATDRRSSPT